MSDLKQNIAIIPARGNSKRIPGKNIIDFQGKPMIAWTIEAARQSALFKRIIVSTDDPEIAEVSRNFGADVPFLRDQYHDDHAPVSLATLVALDQAQEYFEESFETVVQLMPNCPLRGTKEIVEAFENFQKSAISMQISCFRYGWMNPWWAVRLDKNGHPDPLFPETRTKRSQDLDTLYCPTGAIWIANVEALREAGTFYGSGHTYFPMDWRAAVDIDDYDDLDMARVLSELVKESEDVEMN